MLVHLTPEERRDMALRYRRAYTDAEILFLHAVPSQNGRPYRLDDVVTFRRHGQTALDEGVIGLLMSMNDENLKRHTYAVILWNDERLGRRQYRIPVGEVRRPTP